jgi:hypothetical protein
MRTSKAITTVHENQNIDLISDLPSDIHLLHLSKHLAEAIAKFSNTVTYDQAIPLFYSAIQIHLNTAWPGKCNTPYLCKQDMD